jgi:hypothetical protein
VSNLVQCALIAGEVVGALAALVQKEGPHHLRQACMIGPGGGVLGSASRRCGREGG